MNDIVVSVTDASGITTTVTNGSTVSVAVAGNGDTVTVTIAQTGEKGNKGDTGPVGPPNSLSIGTVTKGDTASATITGAAPTQTLSLVLPKGDTGAAALWNFRGAYSGGEEYAVGDVATFNDETWYRINANGGNVGDTPSEGTFWTRLAAKGGVGSTGATGPQGLTGPAGATGSTGPQGDQGATGPQGPQGLTGPAGATGSTGPQGDRGATGPQGPQGLTGPAGATGSTGPQGIAGSFGDPQTISTKTANYTLQLSDVGTLLTLNMATGTLLLTVPSSSSVAWVAGSHIDLARIGSADVQVQGDGASVLGTPGTSLRAVGSGATLVYLGSNSWLLVGDLA